MSPMQLSLIEIFVSVFIEAVLIGGIFTFITNKSEKEQADNIKREMEKIEVELLNVRNDIISEIKERVSLGDK